MLIGGLMLAAAGIGLLSGLSAGGSYLGDVLPGGLLSAAGLGTSLVPSTIAAVQGVEAAESGLASGMINTSRLVGGALGLAALSTLAASHTSARLDAGSSALVAQAAGYDSAFIVGSAVCIVGALAAAWLVGSSPAGGRGFPGAERLETERAAG